MKVSAVSVGASSPVVTASSVGWPGRRPANGPSLSRMVTTSGREASAGDVLSARSTSRSPATEYHLSSTAASSTMESVAVPSVCPWAIEMVSDDSV